MTDDLSTSSVEQHVMTGITGRRRGSGPRAELKQLITAPATDDEVCAEAVRALRRLPRDASPTRLRNRDVVDGRPRAVYRKFGLSRIRLRENAHAGELPGVTKSSW